MFNVQLEQIFTEQKIKDSFLEISSKSKGLDEVSYNEFSTNLSKNIQDIKTSIITEVILQNH